MVVRLAITAQRRVTPRIAIIVYDVGHDDNDYADARRSLGPNPNICLPTERMEPYPTSI